MKSKTLKVYKIECGLCNKEEGDVSNWCAYRITARDVEGAIKIAKSQLLDVEIGEYVESVELICYLNE